MVVLERLVCAAPLPSPVAVAGVGPAFVVTRPGGPLHRASFAFIPPSWARALRSTLLEGVCPSQAGLPGQKGWQGWVDSGWGGSLQAGLAA